MAPRRRSAVAFVTDRDDPVAGHDGATSLLGRKWPPSTVHSLVRDGTLLFVELDGETDGISGKVLSETLGDLEARGLVRREVYLAHHDDAAVAADAEPAE